MVKNYFKLMLGVAAISQIATAQTTYTFTCAGATGETGPTQAQINTAYAATNLSGSVTINAFQGIQEFNIPAGTYSVEAWGAGVNGGFGAKLGGTFNFTTAQKLYIAVGQQANSSAGGNGGTFVSTGTSVATSTPLLVAGGGGGNGGATGIIQNSAIYTTSGNPGDVGFGGTNGFGGQCNTNNTTYGGGGGGGFYGDGTNTSQFSEPGYGFVNGAAGGPIGTSYADVTGGFGGGGAGNTGLEPGGGGGYSGGGGGGYNGQSSTGIGGGNRFGGGGGSYNSGITQYTLGINNNGNGKLVITAISGAALNFDGSNDYVDAGSSITTTLQNTNKLTVEAWVNPSTTSGLGVIAGNYHNQIDGGMQFLLRRDFNSYVFWVDAGSGFQNVGSVATPTTNTWQHVVGTWDGNDLKIYINGVLDNTNAGVTGSFVSETNNVWIGGNNVGEDFMGSIDEVRIWNRALCQSEIQNNMNGEIATTATNLLANYHFNQGYSGSDNTAITTLIDATGNNNGILNGFTLTGATSNFVTPGAVTTGSTVTAFTNTLSAVATATNVVCNGGATGTASVTASGIESPFTYSWSSGGGTGSAQGSLLAGTYTCTIGNACGTITQTVSITQPTQLMVSSTSGAIACNGGATTVTVSATGGTTSYSGDGIMSNVTAGSYTYTVTDANSCSATTTITVTEPQQLMASSTSGTILCNAGATTVTVTETGGTSPYTGDGTMSNVTAGSYSYTVTDDNGCTSTTTITVTEPTQLMATVTSGTIACNGGATTVTVTETGGTSPYSGDGTMSNVTAGSYSYTVTDDNGCTSTTTLTLTEPTQLMASSISGTIACNGGTTTVTVSATGGTPTYSNTGTYTVTANSYTYTVTDANSCTATTIITVSEPNAINASVTLSGETITATNASATYQWVDCNNANAPVSGATNQSFTPMVNGTYAVEVTQAGCTATSTCTTISTVGITKNNAVTNNLQVYPNPFTNELTITSTAKTNAMLFDVLGNKINEFVLQNTTQTISLGDLAPGVYYLQVDTQKIKIIKQ